MRHTVEEVTLTNGARGLLVNVPGASVLSTQFQFRAGNRFVRDKSIYEAAHLMEHMAFGANAEFPDEHSYEAEFTKNGAYHNAYTSDFAMCYIADCADFEWERILKLQRVAICEPRFNEREMKAEKGNVRSELTGYLNNHNRILWPRIQQELGEDIYSYDQRLKTIDTIKLDDIKEHHKRTHTSDNMRFIIAGQIDSERKKRIIENLESWTLPRGERFDAPHDTLKTSLPVLLSRKEASNLTFGVSLVLPELLSDEKDDAMACLNHLLTGTMHSRIYGAARKRGLAYGVFSEVSQGFYNSSWDFGGQVNHETAEPLFDIIVSELEKVKQGGVEESEIESAKRYALGRHQMGAQTVSQISNYYSTRYFTDDFVRDYDNAPNEINAISRDCVLSTARQFFDDAIPRSMAGVSAGDIRDLDALHKKFETLFST